MATKKSATDRLLTMSCTFDNTVYLKGRLQELSEHLLEPHLFPEDL